MGEEDAYGLPVHTDPIDYFDRPHLPPRMIFKDGKWQQANKLSFMNEEEPNPYAENPAFGAF